ncbi:MAG: hypothetical protein M1819_005309 [Sarea resinae]|nr:MAG: hypothetical protein M1819_005309 [Sarea resinae]
MLSLFRFSFPLVVVLHAVRMVSAQSPGCPDYSAYSQQPHSPFSAGKYNLSYQRPPIACRTFTLPAVESTIARLNTTIKDPDLFRLFENTYPNTLDTAVKWKGYANDSREEQAFIITGDINAMWLRDSSSQLHTYAPLLTPSISSSSLASLYRSVINTQSQYILTSPYCNAFQPPPSSSLSPTTNTQTDTVYPPYNTSIVYECKFELDSLAAYLRLVSDYHNSTSDLTFFASSSTFLPTLNTIMAVATNMTTSTYSPDGSVNASPYTFTRLTTRASETLENNGLGNPVANLTGANGGLIRSSFRPSDDATIFQYLIPSNLMFASYLSAAASIVSALNQSVLATQMSTLSSTIYSGVHNHGLTTTAATNGTPIYAYETDGYASYNVMDDANIPSLLSIPLYTSPLSSSLSPALYTSTRTALLSPTTNPYFMAGPIISAIGGPHDGPGFAWPMASIVRITTSEDVDEIVGQLKQLLSSTDGLGTFSWANGLFGQMILDLESRFPEILGMSFQ